MPWAGADAERVVRPALAVLYRMAVGPRADYYVPRFLAFERTRRSVPSWHWPSFFLPSVWAFYRKLWVAGIVFALLPFAGAAAFAAIEPALGESNAAWLALAALCIWFVPCVVPALLANGLLFHKLRSAVARAEARRRGSSDVASVLTAKAPTALAVALCVGIAAAVLTPQWAAPNLTALYKGHVLRARLAESLAAVRPLQQQIEDSVERFGVFPRTPDYATMLAQRGAMLVDDINLNPTSGRLRLALGPAFAELDGKSILLVPAIDAGQRVRWVCVPVGIPRAWLPAECRNG
jgi:hypothetical protein